MSVRQIELLREVDAVVLGQRVRDARLARGLTQSQLAGDDVSVGHVSRIESGQRRPDLGLLERLSVRLGVSVNQILTGGAAGESHQVVLALDLAEVALEMGEPLDCVRVAREVLDAAAPVVDDELSRRAALLLARALEAAGQLDEAIDILEGLERAQGDRPLGVAMGLPLCRCLRESGDLARAIEAGERVMRGLSDLGLEASDDAVQMCVTTAAAYFERGDTEYAVRLCRRALAAAESSGSAKGRASAYWNASQMEALRGAAERAIPLAKKALVLLSEGSDGRNLARLRSQLGVMQLQLDPPEVEEAARHLERAKAELASSSASASDRGRNDVAIARVAFLRGDIDEARAIAASAHAAAVGTTPTLAADARALEGQCSAVVGDWVEARRCYLDAVATLIGVGSDRMAAQLWFELAGLLDEAGSVDDANDAYRRAGIASGLRARLGSVRGGLRPR